MSKWHYQKLAAIDQLRQKAEALPPMFRKQVHAELQKLEYHIESIDDPSRSPITRYVNNALEDIKTQLGQVVSGHE